jgi:hypothetical protein
MTVNVTFRHPTHEDAEFLAQNMRQSDIDELKSVFDAEPLDAVLTSITNSDERLLFSAFADGRLACIFGCVPTEHGIGIPWMLGTPVLDRYAKRLTLETGRIVRMMLVEYPTLTNIIDPQNVKTRRWLECLGFWFDGNRFWMQANDNRVTAA